MCYFIKERNLRNNINENKLILERSSFIKYQWSVCVDLKLINIYLISKIDILNTQVFSVCGAVVQNTEVERSGHRE